jgi:hypothetical protein
MLDHQEKRMGFTDKQISDWRRYEKVRKAGRYNMFSPQAMDAVGLSRDDYIFVMENFTKLQIAAEGEPSRGG